MDKSATVADGGWEAFDRARRIAVPAIRLTYSYIYINKAARDYLGWEKGGHVQIEFSASRKAMRFSKSKGGGLSMRGYGNLPGRAVFNAFRLALTPARDMKNGEIYPFRVAELVDGALIIDVSDLVVEEPDWRAKR